MLRRFCTIGGVMIDYKQLYIDSQRALLGGKESAELTALIKDKAGVNGVKVLIVPRHNPNLRKQLTCACAKPYTFANLIENEIVGYDILVPEDWVKEDSPLLKNGRILGIIMHELGHIVHNDSELNASASEDAHSRRVPVLSEARADRYACESGYARELLSALRWKFWRNPFAGDDIAARIKLVKRWMKKHSA